MHALRCLPTAIEARRTWLGECPQRARSQLEAERLHLLPELPPARAFVDTGRPTAGLRLVNEECIRCGESSGVNEERYCRQCHWIVLCEIEDGIRKLGKYLSCWADFRAWEQGHGI
jgi:hypothetical protein